MAFNFSYLPVGIILNVRPRVSADGNEISMQIDAIVSAEMPGKDLILRDQNGDELASAPRIAARRVQTHARIANNTPFVIAGLVGRNQTLDQDKVLLLGNIPLLGELFKSKTTRSVRREVIIVITPYILSDSHDAGRNMPKDEDAFDSFDHQLFRDAYRIRAEDVFDLAFLLDNRRLK